MQLPSNYRLTELQTLTHVGDGRRASCHAAFWQDWDQRIAGVRPELIQRDQANIDPTDPTADLEFESTGHIPIGCRLLLPRGEIRAGLVTLHGYARPEPLAASIERWQPVADSGVAVLAIRVRGYPGSAGLTGLLTDSPEGWIGHGLSGTTDASGEAGRAHDWVLSSAVADVALACRALARRLESKTGRKLPICLQGESFGGGLAALAAARLSEERLIDRLVLGLPTLGDWPWRLENDTHEGSGGGVGDGGGGEGIGSEVASLLRSAGPATDPITRALRLFDTVLHARKIICPVLCKLAVRDDVVPAPAAASVFNALATPSALRWRFVVPFGHFDGGLSNARRHALFERVTRSFLDPSRDVMTAMADWSEQLDPDERPSLAREAAEWKDT